VPAAVYEVDIPPHTYNYDDDEDDVCAHTHGGGGGLGKFVSSDIVCADIRVGDILMDTHMHSSSQQTNTHDTAASTQTLAAQYGYGRKDKSKSVHTHHHHTHHKHTHDHDDSTNTHNHTHTHNNSGVYVVLRVDLLFARVFVQSCEDLPHCWLSAHTHQAGAGDEGEGVNDRQDKCEVDYNVNGTPFWVRYCVVFVRVCVCVCVGVCNAYQLYNFLLFVSWTIAARVCALECDHPPPTLHHTVLCTHTIRVPCTHDYDHDIAVQTVCDSQLVVDEPVVCIRIFCNMGKGGAQPPSNPAGLMSSRSDREHASSTYVANLLVDIKIPANDSRLRALQQAIVTILRAFCVVPAVKPPETALADDVLVNQLPVPKICRSYPTK
jgi:hypothetical protein